MSKHMHPKKGWSLKGGKIKTKNNVAKSRKISVVCAISDTGLINYKVFEAGVRSSDFFSFLFELVEKNKFLEKKIIFVLDNAHIYGSRFLKKADKFLNFLFLPEYSPQLNPIENYFPISKGSFYKNFIIMRMI